MKRPTPRSLDRYDVIFLNDGSLIVRDRGNPSGGDGIDVVANVERLVFDGTAYAVSDLRGRDKSFNFAFFDFKGGADDDVFIGSVEADRLDGGEGRDTLVGGNGDDLYIVDDGLDGVVERAAGGVDTVVASVDVTLADHVEDLNLSGSAFWGRGNERDNRIVGTEKANKLKGYEGDDVLDGKAGDDRMYGYQDADTLDGGDGNDEINAGDGDDDIDGGNGDDIMRGGRGDDRYAVDIPATRWSNTTAPGTTPLRQASTTSSRRRWRIWSWPGRRRLEPRTPSTTSFSEMRSTI